MSRYVRIATRFWQDEKVVQLSEKEKLLLLYLMTSPHSNMIGFYCLPKLYACADLGWDMKQFTKLFGELLRKGFICYDETASVILIPNYLKYNTIQNINQAKAGAKSLQEIPNNSLIPQFFQCLKRFAEQFMEPFTKLFPEGLPKRYANTETETETEYRNRNRKQKEDILSPDGDATQPTENSFSQENLKNQVINRDKDTIPVDEIVQAYNEICVSMPKVAVISEKRRRQIKALYKRVRDQTQIETVFRKAEESDFLSGRSGKWNGCNFDWLINYNNFVKVLEGTYDNKTANTASLSVLERLYREEVEKEGGILQ